MSDYDNEAIELWVEKIREGDRNAFEKLFLKFYGPLCKFAWRFVRSSDISEELVQDVFLHIWESREVLDRNKNIKSYLYQVVRNKSLNHLKHQDIAEEYNRKIEWLNSTPITQIHNFDEESEFIRAAKRAIEDLPEGIRHIYKLSRKDGLTYREISEVLDIPLKTVESQMSKALGTLRQRLSKYLFTEVNVSLRK